MTDYNENHVPDERTQKRIWGIARYWQRRFRLKFDMLDDIISMAWVAWYERPTVGTERRLQQVFNQVRREIIHEIWHRGFHGAKITEEEPLYRGVIDQLYESDFEGRIRLREITDACKQDKIGMGKAHSDHFTTVRILAGLATTKQPRKKFNDRVGRLRKLLITKGLAA